MNNELTSVGEGTHAIVIGAGMAGLLAARILSDYFDSVTIVERDQLPTEPVARKGVPQAHQLHNLTVRGWNILEQLFPQLETLLLQHGANSIEWPHDMLWLGRAGWSPRFHTGLKTYSSSRYLLEWAVRQQLAHSSNISFLEGTQVTGLTTNQDATNITGITVKPYQPGAKKPSPENSDNDTPTQTISATLVVDASGRTSKTVSWLEDLGYPAPRHTTINPFVGYATRYYTTPPNFDNDWKVMLIQSRPPQNNRAGAIFIMEQDRWVVTLVGVGKDYPPTDEAGFLEFASSLPTPRLAEFVESAQPATPIYGYRIPHNRQIHYDQMSRFPQHFVVLGDAVCSFNPTYGQGMTVSAESVLALDRCLQSLPTQNIRTSNLKGLGQRFQQELARVIAIPWTFTTGEDSRYPTTEGVKRDLQTSMMHWFIDGVMLYAVENPEAHKTFIEVMHMVKPPQALFRPDIALWSASLNVMKHVYQT